MSELYAIRARLAAATPGPWVAGKGGTIDGANYAEVICKGQVDCMSYCYGGSSTIDGDNLKADTDFIANAPTDMARLLAAVETVTGLHRSSPAEFFDMDYGEHVSGACCLTCSDSIVSSDGLVVQWPCPTVKAITEALEAGNP